MSRVIAVSVAAFILGIFATVAPVSAQTPGARQEWRDAVQRDLLLRIPPTWLDMSFAAPPGKKRFMTPRDDAGYLEIDAFDLSDPADAARTDRQLLESRMPFFKRRLQREGLSLLERDALLAGTPAKVLLQHIPGAEDYGRLEQYIAVRNRVAYVLTFVCLPCDDLTQSMAMFKQIKDSARFGPIQVPSTQRGVKSQEPGHLRRVVYEMFQRILSLTQSRDLTVRQQTHAWLDGLNLAPSVSPQHLGSPPHDCLEEFRRALLTWVANPTGAAWAEVGSAARGVLVYFEIDGRRVKLDGYSSELAEFVELLSGLHKSLFLLDHLTKASGAPVRPFARTFAEYLAVWSDLAPIWKRTHCKYGPVVAQAALLGMRTSVESQISDSREKALLADVDASLRTLSREWLTGHPDQQARHKPRSLFIAVALASKLTDQEINAAGGATLVTWFARMGGSLYVPTPSR